MKGLALLLFIVSLQGCFLRGGISLHDVDRDTYFRGDGLIGTVSFTQEIPDTPVEVYFQHKSLLVQREESNCSFGQTNCVNGGIGLNEVGVNLKFKLY